MKFIITIFLSVVLFAGCEKSGTVDSNLPTCLKAMINDLEKEPVRNPPASVWQYEYNGQTVYYVPSYCCDMYGTLYNNDCEIICHPDGGITGGGDGRCTDFFSKRKNEKLLWQDNR